jgi:riboflavin kinase / FMN adenylyltransferase
VNRETPWPRPERSVVAVGLFDGVHRGHQFLLGELKRWASSVAADAVVVTFDPPPAAVISGAAPPLITSPRRRIRLIEELGIERVWLLRTDSSLVRLRAREFLEDYLCGALRAVGLLVGFDNRLGSDQADFAQLRSVGASRGVEVRSCEPFLIGGEPISSTVLRQAITAGDLGRAEGLLGRKVSFAGTVVRGAGRGAGLGFPTANLALEHEVMVPCGIYGGEVRTGGRRWLAAISIGSCPTFNARSLAPARGPYVPNSHGVEVHIIDFEGDLSGQELEVTVTRKLREEEKFMSVEALIAQLQRDVEAIRGDAG